MSKSFETQGIIHYIGETTEFGNNGFTKREFVIKVTGEGENPSYPNYLALELIKDRCALMDTAKLGDEIKVHFNLSGRLWSANNKPEKCFNSLQAWRIEALSADTPPNNTNNVQASQPTNIPSYIGIDDDIPF
jgi:hypothetical protein